MLLVWENTKYSSGINHKKFNVISHLPEIFENQDKGNTNIIREGEQQRK